MSGQSVRSQSVLIDGSVGQLCRCEQPNCSAQQHVNKGSFLPLQAQHTHQIIIIVPLPDTNTETGLCFLQPANYNNADFTICCNADGNPDVSLLHWPTNTETVSNTYQRPRDTLSVHADCHSLATNYVYLILKSRANHCIWLLLYIRLWKMRTVQAFLLYQAAKQLQQDLFELVSWHCRFWLLHLHLMRCWCK